MAIATKLNRKTRAQKIKASERVESTQVITTSTDGVGAISSNAYVEANDYSYISTDLKRIAWTTLACLIILTVITVLMSELTPIEQLRSTLNLPTL